MKFRGPIVAVALLAALGGALYWSNRRKAAETAKTPEDSRPTVMTVDKASISRVEISPKGKPATVLTKDGSGKWQILAPQPLIADETEISLMLQALSSVRAERLVDEHAADLGQYGLADPAVKVQVTAQPGKVLNLLLGDDTPAGGYAYAKLASDPRVFSIDGYTKQTVNKGPNDLRDKRLLPLHSEEITRIEMTVQNQNFAFARNKTDWTIVQPNPMRADTFQVDDLVRRLVQATMDVSENENESKDVSAFASATPVGMVKISDKSGTHELEVRKHKDNYYAKSSEVAGIYNISSYLGEAIGKPLDYYRSKKLFNAKLDDVNRLEISEGSKQYSLDHQGDDWVSNGKKMDTIGARSLLGDVVFLSANKIVNSGFSKPDMKLKVTSDDGKHIENVAISKSGKGYIAKRDDGPELYELTSKDIEDLEKSASDMKPEAIAQKK